MEMVTAHGDADSTSVVRATASQIAMHAKGTVGNRRGLT